MNPQQPYGPVAPAPSPAYSYDPYQRQQQAYFLYESTRKNEGIAIVLEFLVPGVGSVYGNHVEGALVTWGCMVGGMVLMMYGLEQSWEDDGYYNDGRHSGDGELAVLGGVALVVGGRIYGLYDSYASTKRYNRSLRQRLGIDYISVAPMKTPGGNTAWGAAVGVSF
jgi:hypothetical protein